MRESDEIFSDLFEDLFVLLFILKLENVLDQVVAIRVLDQVVHMLDDMVG